MSKIHMGGSQKDSKSQKGLLLRVEVESDFYLRVKVKSDFHWD
jgi:hypothetical protein